MARKPCPDLVPGTAPVVVFPMPRPTLVDSPVVWNWYSPTPRGYEVGFVVPVDAPDQSRIAESTDEAERDSPE